MIIQRCKNKDKKFGNANTNFIKKKLNIKTENLLYLYKA